MKAVILAAGKGIRIKDLTVSRNKCSLEVRGKSIVRRIVDIFKSKQFDIYIITGYKEESIKLEIKGDATYIYNPLYHSAGILLSLWFAKDNVGEESFVLSTGDNLFHPKILSGFLKLKGEVVVAVKKKICKEKDMKVIMKGHMIRKFEQNISAEEAIGEFGMVIKFNSYASKRLFEIVKKLLEEEKIYYRLVDALNILIEQGIEFVPFYFESDMGIEVDTLEDFQKAEKIVKIFDDDSTN